MKISRGRFATVIAALLALVSMAGMAASDSPFLGSKSDPHGTLYLNVDQTAKQTYPVEVWTVDGKLTNRNDQGMLWIKPGDYTLGIKLARSVNLADIPGMQRRAGYGQDAHDLKITVEAGKAYYIGAKFNASGKWEPVVWKTEDQK